MTSTESTSGTSTGVSSSHPDPARPAKRSRAHSWAAILNLVVSVFSVVLSGAVLPAGSAGAASSGDQPPFAIIVFSFALGLIGVLSSYGVWQGQRWGVVLTIVINALSFLSGVPGVAFGPTAFLVISSIIGCALNVVIIYLLLRRRSKPSTTHQGAGALH